MKISIRFALALLGVCTSALSQVPAASSSTSALPAIEAEQLTLTPLNREYPPELIAAGVQGTTIVLATLKADGKLENATIKESSRSPQLDEIALSLLKKISYKIDDKAANPVNAIIVPVVFRKDSIGNLTQKTCKDFNTDLAYFKATFPERKPEDLEIFNLVTGAIFLTMPRDKQMAFAKNVKGNIATSLTNCANQPERKFFEVFKQAADEAKAK